MAEPVFSDSWYRVAELKARLRGHAAIVRHDYRGQTWYVVQDPASGRHHRLSPAAYAIVARLDGQTPLSQVYESAAAELGDELPTQDGVIRLLGLLHAADLLLCDVTPDSEEVFRRYQKRAGARWKKFTNPLSLRLPLGDPEPLLARCLPWLAPLFSVWGALLWVSVVGAGAFQAAQHWTQLTHGFLDRVLEPQGLLLLGLCYPLLKAAHELGHAFAARAFGGEVREFGIALLVFVPSPYVDASSAAAFPERERRVLVGAAGMLVELFLSALAMFVWLAVEPGVVREAAHNTMVIGAVSTVLFNANPLLRFDGYYMLSDWIGVPNLAKRSNDQLAYLAQRHLFGVEQALSPATSHGERVWLTLYGLAAGAYQWFVLIGIAVLVGGRFFSLGLLLAAWIVAARVLGPLAKAVRFLRTSPLLARRRQRAIWVSAGGAAAVLAFLFLLPLPLCTQAQGVVWLPERSQLRAGADGFVQRVLAQPDTLVREGERLIETDDPLLRAEVRALEAQLAETRARYEAAWSEGAVQTEPLRDELRAAEAALAEARQRERERERRSPLDGLFVLPGPLPLDRFLKRGELVGWVTDLTTVTARVVVPQTAVALVRERTHAVSVRLVSDLSRVYAARVSREVPGGTRKLPSAALGAAGGGPFAVSSDDESGTALLENAFEFDVLLPGEASIEYAGQRVYVRFDHGSEPLALRALRSLRRLLLGQFGV
jgi:putative peptide zinc metalloprotease protein